MPPFPRSPRVPLCPAGTTGHEQQSRACAPAGGSPGGANERRLFGTLLRRSGPGFGEGEPLGPGHPGLRSVPGAGLANATGNSRDPQCAL